MTVSHKTRLQLAARSGGMCEMCGRQRAINAHHRKPRKMGGSSDPEIDSIVNLLHLCGSGTTGCHGDIESLRTRAYALGWLVRSWDDPAKATVLLPLGWALLTPEGGYQPVTLEWL